MDIKWPQGGRVIRSIKAGLLGKGMCLVSEKERQLHHIHK